MAGTGNAKSCYMSLDMNVASMAAPDVRKKESRKSAYLPDEMRQDRSLYVTATFNEPSAQQQQPSVSLAAPAVQEMMKKTKPRKPSGNLSTALDTDDPTMMEKGNGKKKRKKKSKNTQETTDKTRTSVISAVKQPLAAPSTIPMEKKMGTQGKNNKAQKVEEPKKTPKQEQKKKQSKKK